MFRPYLIVQLLIASIDSDDGLPTGYTSYLNQWLPSLLRLICVTRPRVISVSRSKIFADVAYHCKKNRHSSRNIVLC